MSRLPPVVVTGMHRSGTSLLCRVLERLGLFLGARKDPNHEALFPQGLNVWMMDRAGARWDRPLGIDDLLGDERSRALAADYVRLRLGSPAAARFTGLAGYARYRGIRSGLPHPWGWKDPRNTFTLPLWLDLFPRARVVYVERNGVDVARSLVERRTRELEDEHRRYPRRRLLYLLRAKRGGSGGSMRCATLEGAFSLWREYVDRGRRHLHALEDRALALRYEDLLADPLEEATRVARFAGLDPRPDRLAAAVEEIRPDRAHLHRDDPELAAFAREHAAVLDRYRELPHARGAGDARER